MTIINLTEKASLSALRIQLHNLEKTIGDLHRLTLDAPRNDPQWDGVWDVVSCLDSIADVMRKALDALAVPTDGD